MDAEQLAEWLMPLCLPLCPLDDPAKLQDYRDVDHLTQRFDEFKKLFPDPLKRPENGHFVVVDGDEGAGKTSLIYRCAHWLKAESKQDGFTVLNQLNMPYPPNWAPGTARLAQLFGRMIAKAQVVELEQAERLLKTAESDLNLAFNGLMRLHPSTFMTLLGPGLTVDEIEELVGAVAPGMVFLLELGSSGNAAACIQRLNKYRQTGFPLRITRLSVGKLQPGDWDRVIDGIALLRSPGMPNIPPDIVTRTFQPDASGLLGLSFYKRLALGSAKLAQQRSSGEVEVDDVFRCFAYLVGQDQQGGQ